MSIGTEFTAVRRCHQKIFCSPTKKKRFWDFFVLFWEYLLMASSKISELNANRFAMVDLGGVWSNSIISPKFLGWSLEKIKIDKFFEIFQFFVWAILFSHELTRTSSNFGENGAIWFAMSEIGGVILTSPPNFFFQRWKSQNTKKKKKCWNCTDWFLQYDKKKIIKKI